jgi:hypothetical protein
MRKTIWMVGLGALLAGHAMAADPALIDWSKIPASTVTLFYPGQSSYEWLRSSEHDGAKGTLREQACGKCHQGDEKTIGDKLVKGGPLEPTPVKGKKGWIDLQVQVAYDARNAHFRLQWKTQNAWPGTEHQYLRFDGKAWKVHGYPKLDRIVQDGQQPALYEDRMSLMIDDGKVPSFAKEGCWASCHNGQRDMPGQFSKDEVAGNALLQAIKKTDVRKYLPATRNDPGDWKTGKSLEEIARIKAAGGFADLIQWRAHRSHGVGMADDGYVLEFRHSDAGKDIFSSNADPQTHAPKFMWDSAKVGYRAITAAQLRQADHFLIREQNAVPFDASANWKEGDMIPDYLISREDARGSAADNKAVASWQDGMWRLVVTRPLGLANSDDKALREGGLYNIGFATHDDNITTRGHHVSFVKTLGFGVPADIQAVKLP